MEWTEDPGVVEALDRYLKESKDDLKDLLDALHPYSNEFPPVANDPLQSLGLGMESVTRNPRFQVLLNGLIDQRVGSVLEGNE